MSKRSNCFSPFTALRYWRVDVGYRLTERSWFFWGGMNVTFDPKLQGITGIWDARRDGHYQAVVFGGVRMEFVSITSSQMYTPVN